MEPAVEAEAKTKPLAFIVLSFVCLFMAWDLYKAFSDESQQPKSDPATRLHPGVGAQSRGSQPTTKIQFPDAGLYAPSRGTSTTAR